MLDGPDAIALSTEEGQRADVSEDRGGGRNKRP